MDQSIQDCELFMRSFSLPDLGEFKDIQTLNDALTKNDCVDEQRAENHDRNKPGDSSLGYNPVRLFSLRLHRSMSMPKQPSEWMMSSSLESDETFSISTASEEEEGTPADLDGFYIPEGDETDDERPDGEHQGLELEKENQPQFYEPERLETLLPPANSISPAETKRLAAQRRERRSLSFSEGANGTKSEKGLETKDDHNEKRLVAPATTRLQQHQQQDRHRQEAASALAAFFGHSKAQRQVSLGTSPKHVGEFPESFTEQASTVDPPPTRDPRQISTPNLQQVEEFIKLKKIDRANSMPSARAMLPRKPSLKKVSSFVGSKDGSSSTTCNNNSSCLKPSVSFSNLSIREYDVTLGDNPSVSFGPPISLGWEYRDTEVVPLDTYEQKRSTKRNTRQLLLSYNMRKYLLLKTAGYSKSEIRDAIKEVNRIKRERQVTDLFLPASKLDEVMEGLMDNVRVLFTRKERQLNNFD